MQWFVEESPVRNCQKMQIYSWSNYPGDATHCHRLYAGLVYISHSKPESYVTYSHYFHSIGSGRFPGSGSYYGYPSTNTTDACYNFESLINQAKLVKRVSKLNIGLFLWTFCYWSQSLTKFRQRKKIGWYDLMNSSWPCSDMVSVVIFEHRYRITQSARPYPCSASKYCKFA